MENVQKSAKVLIFKIMDEITHKTGGGQTIRVQNTQNRVTNNIGGMQRNIEKPQILRSSAVSTHASRPAGTMQNSLSEKMSSGNKIARSGGDASQRRSAHGMKSEVTLSILEKIISVSVFMLFFGVPLFFVNVTYQGVVFEKQYFFYLWTFVGIVALAARGMLGGKIEIRKTPLDIPLAFLWVSCLFSTFFSVDRYHSIFGFFGTPVSGMISITAMILAYYLIVSYVTKERIMMIWWSVVCSGIVVVLWSFMATMRFVPDRFLDFIVPSLSGSFTGLAVFMGMFLSFLIMSFSMIDADMRSSFRAKSVAFLLGIILFVDIFTLSVLFGYVRWFLVIGAIVLLLVFMISRLVHVSQKTTGISLAAFLMLITLFLWGHPIVTRTNIQTEALINYSLSFSVAKEAIADRPFFGSGPSTYGHNFSLYRPVDLNKFGQYDTRFYADRGLLMESISTIGIVGFVALAIVILTFISTVMHAFVQSRDEEMKVIALGLLVSGTIALLYTLFWSVDGVIVIYGVLIAAVLIGVLRGSLAETQDNKYVLSMSASPQHALSFAFLSILVAVGVIFGFVTLGKMFAADVYAGSALRERAKGAYEKSADLFKKAVTLNENEGRYYTVISQYGLELANMELAKEESQRNTEAIVQYIKGATSSALIGKNLMPNDVFANETAGFIYENSGGYVQGALTSSLNAYQRARELEPKNPYLDVAVGKLKLVEAQAKGESASEEKTALINEAKVLFEEARNKTTFEYNGQQVSVFAPAHYYISVVAEASGDMDEAIKSMSTALQVTQAIGADNNKEQQLSREINYGFNLARLLQVRGTEEDNKNAEKILLQIIGINDKEVNSLLSLGLLYERSGRKDEAISEYKKILAILPESDVKARENIQNLIDTIEQGGSNVSDKQETGSDTEKNERQSAEDDANKEVADEKMSILIVKGRDSGNRGEQSQNALNKDAWEVQMRDVDTAYEGVTVIYGGGTDQKVIDQVEQALKARFENVKTERNDAEMATYNEFDVVVTVGSEDAA